MSTAEQGRTLPPAWARLWCAAALALSAPAALAAQEPARPFAHPGLLHGRADLDRIQRKVAAGEEPWKGGFEKLRADPHSRSDWKLRGPFETVTRDPAGSPHNAEMVADA